MEKQMDIDKLKFKKKLHARQYQAVW